MPKKAAGAAPDKAGGDKKKTEKGGTTTTTTGGGDGNQKGKAATTTIAPSAPAKKEKMETFGTHLFNQLRWQQDCPWKVETFSVDFLIVSVIYNWAWAKSLSQTHSDVQL